MVNRSVITVCLFLMFFDVSTAEAAEVIREQVPLYGMSGDFVVGPGKVEYIIEPGQSRTSELVITNRMGDATVFTIDVEDAAGSSNPHESIMLLGDVRGPYSIRDYINLPTNRIELQHGERARIPVTVAIPADAEPGGYYGSVLVAVASDATVQGASEDSMAPKSVLVSRVGALYFVTVPGETVRSGSLQEFTTIPDQSFFTSGPIDFEILFANDGNVHLNPHGSVSITNLFGETIGLVEIDPWYAMPRSDRYLETSFDRSWLFGRYTATVSLNRGYDELSDEAEVTFYVIPKVVLYVSGLVLLMVGYLLWRRLRR